MEQQRAINITRDWLEKVVLKYQLCPFAKLPFQKEQIRYRYAEHFEEADILQILKEELNLLATHGPQEIETTLLILPDLWKDFIAFWDFVGMAENELINWGYEGVFQLATFHPQYQFAGTRKEAASNYTNRSPLPILHLLREDSIEKAIATYPNVDMVPIKNMEKMEKEGIAHWQKMLSQIKKEP